MMTSPRCRPDLARLARATLALACVAAPLGCAPAGYNLKVALAPEFAKTLGDEKVYVHVVGVNPNDRPQLEAISVNRYWRYEDAGEGAGAGATPAAAEPIREADTAMLELTARKPTATLPENDPLWAKWKAKGAGTVMMLASRPMEVVGMSAGAPDPRRRFLPFDRAAWLDADVNVQVTGGGLRVQTGLTRRAARAQ